MMRCYLKILLAFFPLAAAAQGVVVDRQVIGASGALFSGNAAVDASVGETVIATGSSTAVTVTQGFEQPLTKNLISAAISSTPESCRGAADGTAAITPPEGCNPPYNVLWSNGQTGNTATGLETGVYTVSITTDACQTTLTVEVELLLDEACGLNFYSGITPNGDGQNDYWHIDYITSPRYAANTVHIFNRWGSIVWNAENYDNAQTRWEGDSNNGNALPEGTYFYVAEAGGSTFKGYIELTR
jgi:gliding motility-associated-like protein